MLYMSTKKKLSWKGCLRIDILVDVLYFRTNPQGARCQKCLEHGHWTYECKGKRKIVIRDSRMTMLNKKMKLAEEKQKNPNM